MTDDALTSFLVGVVRYRAMTNASVLSWGRTPALNRKLRADSRSLHLVDFAVDVVYDELPALRAAHELAQQCGLRLRREGDHDHLEPLNQGDPHHASR